jgi:hypothetical protein
MYSYLSLVFIRYTGAWTADDMAFVVPNRLEAFIRSAISYHIGQKNKNKFLFKWIEGGVASSSTSEVRASVETMSQQLQAEVMTCSTSADCASAACDAVSYKYYEIKLECIQGQCVCPTAFYHIALDPGGRHMSRYTYISPYCES